MVTQFEKYLVKANLAKSTVTSYLWTINYFLEHYKEVNKKNLLAYKGYLMENFKPQTVNLRLQAMNKFLEFSKQDKLKMKFVKAQQKNFLENAQFKQKQRKEDMRIIYSKWLRMSNVSQFYRMETKQDRAGY